MSMFTSAVLEIFSKVAEIDKNNYPETLHQVSSSSDHSTHPIGQLSGACGPLVTSGKGRSVSPVLTARDSAGVPVATPGLVSSGCSRLRASHLQL